MKRVLNWQQKLFKCLQLGISDDSLFANLNETLSWYSSFASSEQNDAKDALSVALLNKYSQSDVRARFEEFLDRLLISNGNLDRFFNTSDSEASAKKRYRQLIRVFHPDRGAKDQDWLNYRAEKINRAYNAYKERDHNTDQTVFEPVANKPAQAKVVKPNKAKSAPTGFKLKYRSSNMRNVLGNPKDVQRRLLIGLGCLSFFLILVFYASSRPTEENTANAFDNTAPLNSSPAVSDEASEPFIEVDEKSILSDAIDKIEQDFNTIDQGVEDDAEIDFVESEAIDLDIRALTSTEQLESSEQTAEIANSDDQQVKVSIETPNPSNTAKPATDKPQAFSQKRTKTELEPSKEISRKESVCSASRQVFGVALRQKGSISSDNIQIRTAPSTDCSVVAKLSKNTPVTLLNKNADGRWFYIETQVNNSTVVRGWIKNSYFIEQVAPIALVRGNADIKKVNKRSDLSSSQSATKNESAIQQNSARSIFESLLERYTEEFETGNLDGLLSLYMSEAEEDELKGLKKIARYYKGAFSRTRQRKLRFSVDRFLHDDELTAIVSGTYTITFNDRVNDDLNEVQDRFKILFFRTSQGYKIASLDWSN